MTTAKKWISQFLVGFNKKVGVGITIWRGGVYWVEFFQVGGVSKLDWWEELPVIRSTSNMTYASRLEKGQSRLFTQIILCHFLGSISKTKFNGLASNVFFLHFIFI